MAGKTLTLLGVAIGLVAGTSGCKRDFNEGDAGSETEAIESNNWLGPVDRVYLAFDDVDVAGYKAKALYYIGCVGESRDPKAKKKIYFPGQGWKTKGLHQRVWLHEFTPVEKGKHANKGQCEVLFGDPRIQKFATTENSATWFGAVGVATASCIGMAGSVNSLMGVVGAGAGVFGLLTIPPVAGTLAVAGVAAGTFLCLRNSKGIYDHAVLERIEKNQKLFAEYFAVAGNRANSLLNNNAHWLAKEYTRLNNWGGTANRMAAAGIFAQVVAENFNSDLDLWENTTGGGKFDQGWKIDIRGSRQFFYALESLSAVSWSESQGSDFYAKLPTSVKTPKSNCEREVTRHHSFIKALPGIPVYSDQGLNNRIGYLPDDFGVYRRLTTHTDKGLVRRVKLLAGTQHAGTSFQKDQEVWVHSAFVTQKIDSTCLNFVP